MKKFILISVIVLSYIMAYGQNNTGIGTTTPTSTLQVLGTVSMPIVTTAGSLDLTNGNYYTVIYTGGATGPTFTLPDPATCKGRMYHLVNGSFGANYHDIILSRPIILYTNSGGGTTTTVTVVTYATVSVSDPSIGNTALIQSDGTQWWRVGL